MPELTAPWTEPVHQRLRAWRDGQLLLDTHRAHLHFPDERHPRWAVPADDLRLPAPGAFTRDGLAVLSPGDADTWVEEDRQAYGDPRNPYYVRDTDIRLWTYRHPDPEAAAIAGHIAAAGEDPGVRVIVDGTPERQP